jgi:chemotaxis protein MotA
MVAIVGLVVVFAAVFGGYTIAGGKMAVILHVLPHEMLMIGGAAVGTFLIGNDRATIRGVMADLPRVVSGARFTPSDYRDLLSLMYMLVRHIKIKGVLALESHIDAPAESPIFKAYPKILNDHFAIHFITDTLRMVVMSLEDPHQVEDCMQRQIERHEQEMKGRVAAVQTIADALPALGIVAAVLGVVKTMGSITAPVEVLGAMIGGALVGTFLGVFLAYGLVAPMAAKLHQVHEQDGRFYAVIRDCIVAMLHGQAAPIAIELARGNVPTSLQPSFHELEQLLQALPNDITAAPA